MTLGHIGPLPWEELGLDTLIWLGPALASWLYYRGWSRLRGASKRGWRLSGFALAILTVAAALSPQLEEAAEALFSIHMVQHLLFLVVIPVLLLFSHAGRSIIAGLPQWMRSGTAPWRRRARRDISPLLSVPVAAVLFGLVLWAWHIPALYDAAVGSELIHEIEHTSLLIVALFFWALIADVRREFVARAILLFVTAFHSGLLGAILVFAPAPLYQAHLAQHHFAIDPLTDQQVAGAIMWMLMGGVFLTTLAVLVIGRLGLSDNDTRRTVNA